MSNQSSNKITIVVVYVDDLILTGSDDENIGKVKQELKRSFKITDIGLLHFYLRIEVKQDDNRIFMNWEKFASDLLQKFNMTEWKSATAPMETGCELSKEDTSDLIDATLCWRLVGSVIYLTSTWPDIVFAVGKVSRFMCAPRTSHWLAAKRILRYIRGTTNYGLEYSKSDDLGLVGFSDSDWSGSKDDRRSTSGYRFSIESTIISWNSKKQPTISLSSTEAEYKASLVATCELIWLKELLKDLKINKKLPISLYCDNQSAIKIAKNLVFHARTKHIEVQYHFIIEKVLDKIVDLTYCPTEKQLANIFTKPLGKERFQYFKNHLKVKEKGNEH